MKYINIMIWIVLAYAMLVLLAEALIWRIQPSMEGGVRLTIASGKGAPIQRKLYGFEQNGSIYVSSNHWFRQWYHAALRNPNIEVLREGVTGSYIAQAVVGEEHQRLWQQYNMGFFLRLLCGFAPSKFVKLVPTP